MPGFDMCGSDLSSVLISAIDDTQFMYAVHALLCQSLCSRSSAEITSVCLHAQRCTQQPARMRGKARQRVANEYVRTYTATDTDTRVWTGLVTKYAIEARIQGLSEPPSASIIRRDRGRGKGHKQTRTRTRTQGARIRVWKPNEDGKRNEIIFQVAVRGARRVGDAAWKAGEGEKKVFPMRGIYYVCRVKSVVLE
ncbi:hypothetical protein BV20DRAFT_382287 [Pilatotrama ljubarskyi]|nr:hypothetical protein BV20DRAFT_382287 [Pilatotrama ljubarskyi]